MYKLSIIIPIYGVEKYLNKCLDSIYSQATDECQIILVDDQSPDRCGEICEEYKVKYPLHTTVIHQENMGLGGARNSGIRVATGEYLYFIDSDDYIPEGAVATLLDAIEKYNADVYVFPFRLVDEEGKDLGVCRDNMPTFTPLPANINKHVITGYPNAWNKVAKARLYKETGISFPSRVWYEDIRTTPKMFSKADTVVYLEKDMYNYLQREGSIMNNAKVDRNIEIIEAFEDLIGWFKNEGIYEEYRDELDYLLIDHVFVSATVRIIRSAGSSHPLVRRMRDYTFANISDGAMKNNRYVSSVMPRNHRIIMNLLKAKMYFAVKLIFKIKG
ncbi:MAG: glycosyltransferase [Clostridia bacterium]|nr:glycosyltransferase [Clostridia bacterium]